MMIRELKRMIGKCGLPCILAIAGLMLSGCQENDTPIGDAQGGNAILRFSAIPDSETTAQTERYAPLRDYLAEALGVSVEFVPASSYGASVEKFQNGDINLAWFGGVTGVQARERVEGAQAIAAGEKDLQFHSYFITHHSTEIDGSDNFPMAIKDLSFTFGSPSSTSGTVMPVHFIIQNTGMTPNDFFTRKPIGFSGAHDKTALLVQNGTYQAGALNYSSYHKLVDDGTIDPEKCKVIWKSPAYADYNFTAHPQLEAYFGEGFIEKLQKVLVECTDAGALNALDRTKIVPVTNATFDGISEVLKAVTF